MLAISGGVKCFIRQSRRPKGGTELLMHAKICSKYYFRRHEGIFDSETVGHADNQYPLSQVTKATWHDGTIDHVGYLVPCLGIWAYRLLVRTKMTMQHNEAFLTVAVSQRPGFFIMFCQCDHTHVKH